MVSELTRLGPSGRERRLGLSGRERRLGHDERGSGVFSAWFGFIVFLALLLFAVQVLFNLYATSVVNSVAYDAARKVAGSRGGPGSASGAEAEARRALGRYGDRVSFSWSGTDADVVVLRVRSTSPSVLLPAVAGPMAFGDIDRTVRVRVERFR